MTKPVVLGIGGAHIDRRGQVAGAFVPGASNPGVMGEEVGGGTFNALRAAVARGVAGSMLSVRGGDAAGEAVARAIAQAGIRDLSVTFLDRGTPSYTAILSCDGDVIAALADMGLYEQAFGKQMRRASLRAAIAGADAVLCDANLPQAALSHLPGLCAGKPLYAIAISPAKAMRLRPILADLACLFLNTREAAALTGQDADSPPDTLIAGLRSAGLSRGVMTRAAAGVVAFEPESCFSVAPPPPRIVRDVTGAGDALAGATVAALLAGAPFDHAVRHGMAAALLAIESAACAPQITPDAFAGALALVQEAAPLHQESETRASHVA